MKIERNWLKFAIRAQVQPSVNIHAAGLLDSYRTLTKSNILHQSQRLKCILVNNEKYIPASFAHMSC